MTAAELIPVVRLTLCPVAIGGREIGTLLLLVGQLAPWATVTRAWPGSVLIWS
jgi:hypothetical protein